MALDSPLNRLSMLTFSAQMNSPLPWPADTTLATAAIRSTFLSLYGGLTYTTRHTNPLTTPDPGLLYWGRPGTGRRPERIRS